MWGAVNAHLTEYYASNTPPQNLDADFEKSARLYGTMKPTKRCVQQKIFYKQMTDGEKVNSKKHIYSPSTGKVYCYICKIFQPLFQIISNSHLSQLEN